MLLGLASVTISFIFGDDGVESFAAIYLITGLLLTYACWRLVPHIWRARLWLIVRIIGLILLVLFWIVAVVPVVALLMEPTINPKIPIEINWWIVLLSLLGYAVLKKRKSPEVQTLETAVAHTTTLLLAAVLMFVGYLMFAGTESRFGSLMLVIVVQLQFIMNYLFIETDYIVRVHGYLQKRLYGSSLRGSEQETMLYAFLVGAPFFISILLLIIIASIGR